MRNNGRQNKEKELTTMSNAWHARRVISVLKKDEINKMAAEASGLPPGDKGCFAYYQKSVTRLMSGMTKEDLVHYDKLANEWTQRGCPPEVQEHNWQSTGMKFLQGVVNTAFLDYGMRIVICGTVKDKSGQRVMHL